MNRLKALQQKQKEEREQKEQQGQSGSTGEGVFSLKKEGVSNDNNKKVSAADLRTQKDIAEMDPIPGTKLVFPDKEYLKFWSYL